MNPTDHSALLNDFFNALQLISTVDEDEFKRLFESSSQALDDDVLADWSDARSHACEIYANKESIEIFDQNQIKSITKLLKKPIVIHLTSNDEKASSRMDSSQLEDSVTALSTALGRISLSLLELKKFVSITANPADARDLDFYIAQGDKIRQSEDFQSPSSQLAKLDRLIANPAEFFKKNKDIRPKSLSAGQLRRSFVALISPSLTGKTQSAFVVKSKKPLYFAFQDIKAAEIIQGVYGNFFELSKTLSEMAIRDLERLSTHFKYDRYHVVASDDAAEQERAKTFHENVAAHNLFANHSDFKFFSLGLLYKLVEDSETDFESSGKPWMKYHAERGDFSFVPKSLNEFRKLPNADKYFVFLDEYVGHGWAVLLRNIFRAADLMTIVANTNTVITNLLGHSSASASRTQGSLVWSVVFTHLDSAKFDVLIDQEPFKAKLIEIVPEDDQDKTELVERVFDESSLSRSAKKNGYIRFFHELLHNQMPKLRPGMTKLIENAVLKFSTNQEYNLSKFVDFLISDVSDQLQEVKKLMVKTPSGQMATLALYLSNAYDKDLIKMGIEHRTSYLQNHLFHLISPVVDKNRIFVTYHPSGETKNLLNVHTDKTVIANPWMGEGTYFEREEVFTILACLFIKRKSSIAKDLLLGSNESRKMSFDTATTQNPLALKLNGDELEVLAAISVMDASHRLNGSLQATLSGQNGLDFLKNVIGNLIIDFPRTGIIDLNLSSSGDFDLSDFLAERCRIPFLYPANCELPDFIETLNTINAANIGTCHRIADAEKIDLKLVIEYNPVKVNPLKRLVSKIVPTFLKVRIVAECKHWTKELDASATIKILKRALKVNGCIISLIFCNEFKANLNSLTKFCQSKRRPINLYTFRKTTQGTQNGLINISLGDTVIETSSKPKLVCFIFESKKLNDVIQYISDVPVGGEATGGEEEDDHEEDDDDEEEDDDDEAQFAGVN